MNIKASYFLQSEIKPYLFGVFLSRIMEKEVNNKKYFYCYSRFKSSKYIFQSDFSFKEFAPKLQEKFNRASGYYNWEITNKTDTMLELQFKLENDLNLTTTQFYRFLYQKLMTCDWPYSEELTDEKKSFIRGFCESRGSVDTKLKWLSQDYYCDNKMELKKALLLTDMMNLPCEYANFNARELQPDYIKGKKRNTQFRINLFYYAKIIGFINDYKAKIFEKSYKVQLSNEIDGIFYYDVDLPKKNDSTRFIEYLNVFTNNIYQTNLTKEAIAALRDRLGFSSDATPEEKNKHRNQTIIELYRDISEDKCAICGTTKTYENARTHRQHFEIHHVISYANGQECDNIANLVKLCPTCHDKMKRNATHKEEQVKAIIKILSEHPEVFEFSSSYFGVDDINDLSEEIWKKLK